MNYFHVSLIRAAAAHRKYCRRKFQVLGLTEGQPKVLTKLRGMEGCRQKDLAQACRVEPATMTSLLKKMGQKDLIYKEPLSLAGGKRAQGIYLTEHGRKMADEVMEIMSEMEHVGFEGFTPGEWNEFLKLFQRVSENLEKQVGISE